MNADVKDKIEYCYKRRFKIKEMLEITGMKEKEMRLFLKEQPYFVGFWVNPLKGNVFYFENIDSEEKAYWLGFIYADGWITKDGTLGIELKQDDFSHLEKFKKCLELEAEVKFYTKQSTFGEQKTARISTTCKKTFIPHLLKHFGSLDKTNFGKLPKLPEPLMQHCLRGFFDGDGSLSGKPKNDNLVWRPSLSFIGTYSTMKEIEIISGFNWSWSQRFPERGVDNWQINIGRVNDSLSFLNYLYSDATIYLDRKFESYQNLLSSRKKYNAKARG